MNSRQGSKNCVALRSYEYLWDYQLAILPADPVRSSIQREKDELFDRFHSIATTDNFISLANFSGKPIMEETISRWIQNICKLHQSFEICLNNFSGFPPGNIYLRILPSDELFRFINQLKMLDNFIQANECPPLCTVAKPQMELAVNLNPVNYEHAIKYFAQRTFSEKFKVEKLCLLRRSFETEPYQVVNSFALPVFLK